MSKTALITGICGQDGSFLANLLLQKNYQVTGLCLPNSTTKNLDHFKITDSINLIECNITDQPTLEKALLSTKPDEVYHLAAFSSPGHSWNAIDEVTQINALGSANLINALQKHLPETKLFNASSREIFGDNHQNGTQTETTPLAPKTPYGTTKAFTHMLIQNLRHKQNSFYCNGILYNHESHLRPNHFVTRKITESIAKITKNKQDKIELMNINSMRDWGFAGDYVEAMWLILQQEKPNDYIISTGQNHTIQDLLEIGFDHVNITNWADKITITTDNSRPPDPQIPTGDNSKLKQTTGWKPKTSFADLIKSMIDYDLNQIETSNQ